MGRWMQRARELRELDERRSASDTMRAAPDDGPEAEIAWRAAAFRARIPAAGAIWPPRLRQTARCDTPGHCSLCGDALPPERVGSPWRRCAPCVRALWLALHEGRERVGEA
jgi:hypothetical protein